MITYTVCGTEPGSFKDKDNKEVNFMKVHLQFADVNVHGLATACYSANYDEVTKLDLKQGDIILGTKERQNVVENGVRTSKTYLRDIEKYSDFLKKMGLQSIK